MICYITIATVSCRRTLKYMQKQGRYLDVVKSVSPERARNTNKGGKEKVIISLEAKHQT